MAETPKNRDELLMELSDGMTEESGRFAERFIERIEALGIRLLPVEPTDEMLEDAQITAADYYMLLLASPFAKDKADA